MRTLLISFWALFSNFNPALANCASIDGDSTRTEFAVCLNFLKDNIAKLPSASDIIKHDHDTDYSKPTHTHEDVGGHSHEHSHASSQIPSGAVLMFSSAHSEDPTEPCPAEWSLLQEAAGRMPIGAGQPANGKLAAEFRRKYGQYERYDPATGETVQVDLRPYRQIDFEWQYYRGMEVGGVEDVALANTQMQKHSHVMFSPGSGNALDQYPTSEEYVTAAAGPEKVWRGDHSYQLRTDPDYPVHGKTGDSGNAQPHNNMPPYIALYFCKKD